MLYSGHQVRADINLPSFGGGFELMKAGGDNDDIWTLIESFLRYLSWIYEASCLHLTCFSVRAITAHVSYVVPLLAFTGRKGSVQRISEFGRGRAIERLKMGANRKDLFYHLVRARGEFSASSWPQEADYRAAKRCLKTSAQHLMM